MEGRVFIKFLRERSNGDKELDKLIGIGRFRIMKKLRLNFRGVYFRLENLCLVCVSRETLEVL